MHISELSLFHYYERAAGPFRSLTSLPEAEAQAVQASLTGFAAQRSADYLSRRGFSFFKRAANRSARPRITSSSGNAPFWQAGITIPRFSACR